MSSYTLDYVTNIVWDALYFKARPDMQHLISLPLFRQRFENRFYGYFKYQTRKEFPRHTLA